MGVRYRFAGYQAWPLSSGLRGGHQWSNGAPIEIDGYLARKLPLCVAVNNRTVAF